MKSPPKVSKSATTKFLRSKWCNAAGELIFPLSVECKAWFRERRARERASCELIVKKAKERWGPEWTFPWYKVEQLLHLIFGVAIDQMIKTQKPFNLAGLLLLKTTSKVVKARKDAKINTNTGRHSVATYEPQIRFIPMKWMKHHMVRLSELRGFARPK